VGCVYGEIDASWDTKKRLYDFEWGGVYVGRSTPVGSRRIRWYVL